jgi:cyclomaltodextrinase / maltogenic alpha-amylase / neopullulanase
MDMIAPADSPVREPDWVADRVWWHVYPLGLLDAERTANGVPITHRLPRLVDWLDYAVELGASGLALGPIFASTSHGYDTVDYFRIDPRLGDRRDFDHLLEEAHTRGLRVLLDGVFNHVSREYPLFREVVEHGSAAPGRDWFRLSSKGYEQPVDKLGYATFEGHPDLVALNHENADVLEHVVSVIDHWLTAGADGWRLDAAYAVPRRFWKRAISRVRTRHPDAYFFGEVIHGDYAAIVRDSAFDAVTQSSTSSGKRSGAP